MAKDKKKSNTTSSCFPSCFKVPDDPARTRPKGAQKKLAKWIPLPRAWFKKSGAKTVVPVDAVSVDVESEKAEAKRRFDESRLKSKPKVKRSKSSEKLAGSKRRVPEAPAASDQDKPREIRTEQGTTKQDSEPDQSRSDHPEPVLDDTCQHQKGLSGRKTDNNYYSIIIGAGSGRGSGGSRSHPCSLVPRTRPGTMTRSASFPAPPRKKQRQSNGGVSGNFDPLVGMSIIMVTLIIMVLWGRLCAVLCTCAWFYFIPRMHLMGRSDGGGESSDPDPDPVGLDFCSEEYKKKVVLEGFLERNRRSLLRERGYS